MFEHFIFGAQATHFQQEDESIASPTDTSCLPLQSAPTSYPFPDQSPGPAMNDILSKLDNQTLVPSDNDGLPPSIRTGLVSTSTFKDNCSENHEFTYFSTRHGFTTLRPVSPSRRPSPNPNCKRLQRQINTHLQSCTSHVKDINTLVEDMVSSNSQCTVHPAPIMSISTSPLLSTPSVLPSPLPPIIIEFDATPVPIPPPPPTLEADLDEGFSELDDLQALELLIQQQAEERETSKVISLEAACVPSGITKFGLIRQSFGMGMRRYRGMDGESNSTRENGKVRSVPRMRRRKNRPA